MAKSVEQQISEILTEFLDKETRTIERTFNLVGNETKEKLKAISPRQDGANGGAYARSWTLKKTGRRASGHSFGHLNCTVYNKDHYRLTHLLEHGHVVRNQYGTPKKPGKQHRAQAVPHIAKAEEYGNKRLLEELERNL